MKNSAPTIFAVLFVAAIVGVALVSRGGSAAPVSAAPTSPSAAVPAAQVPAGAQVISITAKGGYAPESSSAKAGVPTVLKVSTSGTYDCSTALRIPSLGISTRLPATGETVIDLGTPAAGVLRGTCSMGMYSFEINFQA